MTNLLQSHIGPGLGDEHNMTASLPKGINNQASFYSTEAKGFFDSQAFNRKSST